MMIKSLYKFLEANVMNIQNNDVNKLDLYKNFLSLLEDMLSFARQDSWDKLTQLQDSYYELSKTLPDLSAETDLSDEFKTLAKEILQEIIEKDSFLRSMIENKRNTLGQSLNTLNSQHKVHTTYTKFSDQGIANQILKDL